MTEWRRRITDRRTPWPAKVACFIGISAALVLIVCLGWELIHADIDIVFKTALTAFGVLVLCALVIKASND